MAPSSGRRNGIPMDRFPIFSNLYYTQVNISPRFHDGNRVCRANIQPHWKINVTRAPNGKWYTLNNRLLFAYKECNWSKDGRKCFVLGSIPIQNVVIHEFEDVLLEFSRKYTTKDKGITCYRRGLQSDIKDRVYTHCMAEYEKKDFCTKDDVFDLVRFLFLFVTLHVCVAYLKHINFDNLLW